jgi:hypothetical protein
MIKCNGNWVGSGLGQGFVVYMTIFEPLLLIWTVLLQLGCLSAQLERKPRERVPDQSATLILPIHIPTYIGLSEMNKIEVCKTLGILANREGGAGKTRSQTYLRILRTLCLFPAFQSFPWGLEPCKKDLRVVLRVKRIEWLRPSYKSLGVWEQKDTQNNSNKCLTFGLRHGPKCQHDDS